MRYNLAAFERVISLDGLETIKKALTKALDEIHNPGCARVNNYDILDLIDQAQEIVTIVQQVRK